MSLFVALLIQDRKQDPSYWKFKAKRPVMTSFYHVMTLTRGNWLEHESNDGAGNTVSSLCVTSGKDTVGTSAKNLINICHCMHVLWFCKTEIQDRVLVRVLSVSIFKIYRQFLHSFFKYTCKSSSNFYTRWNNVKKNCAFSLFETSVNGNVTSACIMTFHCTSVLHFWMFWSDYFRPSDTLLMGQNICSLLSFPLISQSFKKLKLDTIWL